MESKKDTCILLFVKYPQKGQVKQRLALSLQEDVVVELYQHFVQDILQTIEMINVPFFICVFPEEKVDDCRRWLRSSYSFLPQKGKNLGERMKNSFQHAFSEGFHRVILLGSDIPDLPNIYLTAAFYSLEEYTGVIGPCSDGGYYLIGFSEVAFQPSVFDQITWSTPKVFEETMQQCTNAGISMALLPEWSDIDTLDDLKEFILRNHDIDVHSSLTMKYVSQNPELSKLLIRKI